MLFRRMLARALLVAWACVAAASGSCSDNTPQCIPGTAVNGCFCETGERGHKVCTDDGLGFGECLCGEVDAGAARENADLSGLVIDSRAR